MGLEINRVKYNSNWEIVRLKELCTRISDGTHFTPKYVSGGIPFISVKDIYDDKVHFGNCKYISYEDHKELIKRCFPERGDLLITKSGTIGRMAIVPDAPEFSLFVSVALIKNKKDLIGTKFLKYCLENFLNHINIAQDIKGGLLKNFHLEDIRETYIPLPPLPEQQAIVAKIEELLSDLDKGVQQLQTAQQQLKVYRQSLLKAAFEGKLTHKEVKDGELPEGWKVIQIGDICKCIVPNRDKPKTFTGDIKWVTTPNLSPISIRLNYQDISFGLSEKEIKDYNAKVIPEGSVIMTCVGTFGLSAIVERSIVINQQLHAFLPNDHINSKYLAYCIQRNRSYFEKKSTSTTIQYLNKENCNSMPLPICSIDEQQLIVCELESKLTVCDKIEETIQQSLQQAESLRQSILKKAFEGRLVSYHQTQIDSRSLAAAQRNVYSRNQTPDLPEAAEQRHK